jgi:hypothetical protein
MKLLKTKYRWKIKNINPIIIRLFLRLINILKSNNEPVLKKNNSKKFIIMVRKILFILNFLSFMNKYNESDIAIIKTKNSKFLYGDIFSNSLVNNETIL